MIVLTYLAKFFATVFFSFSSILTGDLVSSGKSSQGRNVLACQLIEEALQDGVKRLSFPRLPLQRSLHRVRLLCVPKRLTNASAHASAHYSMVLLSVLGWQLAAFYRMQGAE